MKVDIKRTDIISQEDLISARTLSFKDKNLFLINCISTENIATDKKAGKKFSETSRERFNEGLEQSQQNWNKQKGSWEVDDIDLEFVEQSGSEKKRKRKKFSSRKEQKQLRRLKDIFDV
jgi:hypothetical protein